MGLDGSDGPSNELSAAVWAHVHQRLVRAYSAPRALVRADPSVVRVGRKVAVAEFAVRTQFERRHASTLILNPTRSRRWQITATLGTRIPLDDNATERGIRGPVVGRKNQRLAIAARHRDRLRLVLTARDREALRRRSSALSARKPLSLKHAARSCSRAIPPLNSPGAHHKHGSAPRARCTRAAVIRFNTPSGPKSSSCVLAPASISSSTSSRILVIGRSPASMTRFA